MKKLIVLATFLIIFSGVSVAQEAAQKKILTFSNFSGGIATKVSDQSTNPKYARIAENVRLGSSLTAISKRDQLYLYGTADTTEPITGMYRLYLIDANKYLIVNHGDELEVGNDSTGAFTNILTYTYPDYRWQWLGWHDIAIGGDGYNQPVKTNGSDATYLGSLYAEDNGAGAGPNGTYTYKVSCHATTQALEFNQVSNSVTVVDNDIDLSMIPIGPDTINGETILYRKIYRNTVAAPTTWYLLSNGKISDNSTLTLTDSDADGGLGAETYSTNPASVTEEVWTAPKGKFYLIHKNRLWIASNPDHPSRIYYSEDGSHDLFDPLSYYDIRTNDGDEITFIKNLLGILTVGKTNTIQKIYTEGDDPAADWSISDPFSHIGCDSPYSAVNTPLGIFYLSRAKTGIYLFNGQNSVLKSEQVTPVIQDILSSNLGGVYGEYNNNIYYMAYPSSITGGSTNNRLLVYDMLADAYTIDTLSLNYMTSLTGSSDGGELCAGSSVDGKVFNFQNSAQTVIFNKHSDFGSGTHPSAWAHARYIPVDIGGDPNSPILEIAWSNTINDQSETVDGRRGRVDRSAGNGSYISPIINTNAATSYDKFYWNEIIPSGTHAVVSPHVSVAVRSGDTHTECIAAAWSAEYDTSSGSDISGVTTGSYTQYRLSLGTNDLSYTPEVYTLGGYTTKLTYRRVGTAAESTIVLHWQTGFLDFGAPGYKKTLRKLVVYHEGTNGTLNITFTNEHGDTDSFAINLATNPTLYEEYFTTGAFTGTKFKMDLENSDLNALRIKEIVIVYDISPLV